MELPVFDRTVLSVKHHKPASVTLAHRFLCDQLFRKIIIKIINVHIYFLLYVVEFYLYAAVVLRSLVIVFDLGFVSVAVIVPKRIFKPHMFISES